MKIEGSRGIHIYCDKHLEDCVEQEYDMIVLPGGLKNAQLLAECNALIDRLKK